MVLHPIRRSYSEIRPREGLKDLDAPGRAQKLHALGWAIYAGIPVGAGMGFIAGKLIPGLPTGLFLVLGLLMGPVLIYALVTGIAAAAGRGASRLYAPSGRSTPRRVEYSRAQALEVRGAFDEAIQVYEACIGERPEVGEPYLRLARIYRDEMGDMEGAVRWFRRAQREARLLPGEAIRTHREVAEIFLHRLREPRKAAPELAQLAEAFPHTPDGTWALEELREIKDAMAREHGGEPPAS